LICKFSIPLNSMLPFVSNSTGLTHAQPTSPASMPKANCKHQRKNPASRGL
jgi:hypothetical protein